LQTKNLRWSYGAMKGRRAGDWQLELGGLPTRTALATLEAVGFQGVYINRDGYALPGTRTTPSAFEGEVAAVLGSARLTSTDARLVYYDLAPMRAVVDRQLGAAGRAALRAAALSPVSVDYADGFYDEEIQAPNRWHWADKQS